MAFCETFDKPSTWPKPSIQENIEKVKKHVSTFEAELIEAEKEVQDYRNAQKEGWDMVITDWEAWYRKTKLERKITYLKGVLDFLEDNENENKYIRDIVTADLAIMAGFKLERDDYSDEIRAAYMRLNKLRDIEGQHLKDTRKSNKTLRDIVESAIIPSTDISVLTPASKKIVDKWFDLIAQEYLNTYFGDFIEVKQKKRWKCNPDEIKTWEIKSEFDKQKFTQEWFPLTIWEFESLMSRAFKNAEPNILKVFNHHTFSVKLNWEMILIW